jgi:hypothetical protein
LLSKGADATLWDRRQEATPLHLAAGSAAAEASLAMMTLLINNRGDINAGVGLDGGGSVLHAAVRANNIGAVRFLLDNKVQTVTKKFSGRLLGYRVHCCFFRKRIRGILYILTQRPFIFGTGNKLETPLPSRTDPAEDKICVPAGGKIFVLNCVHYSLTLHLPSSNVNHGPSRYFQADIFTSTYPVCTPLPPQGLLFSGLA